MRFQLITVFVAIAAVSVLLFIGASVARTYQSLMRKYDRVYSNWLTADLIIEHLESDGGQWPRGWEDLADDHKAIVAARGSAIPFDQLSSIVQVDWDANIDELREMHEDGVPTFVVISSLDDASPHVAGNEPNQLILDYLINN